jgi:type VI protein secretion system component Hcp
MSRTSRGTQQTVEQRDLVGTNRREVLLGAGGLAAVAAVGRSASDKQVPRGQRIHCEITGLDPFEVRSLEMGDANTVSFTGGGGGGASSGRAEFEPVRFSKVTDAMSPLIMRSVASGKRYADAIFTVTSKRSTRLITYHLRGAVFSGFANSIDILEDLPIDDIALDYERIELKVDTVVAGWDRVRNTQI